MTVVQDRIEMPFTFKDTAGRRLRPQRDITPGESVQLCQLMIWVMGGPVDGPYVEQFIRRNDLTRHFTYDI
jgi:hypothetical protein